MLNGEYEKSNVDDLKSRCGRLEAENSRLREALIPFAEVVEYFTEPLDFRCFIDIDYKRDQSRESMALIIEYFLDAAEALKKKED